MDQPANKTPTWLPWVGVACLAAAVACVGEMLSVERVRGRILRDQAALAQAALESTQNQLDAETIIERRAVDVLHKLTPDLAGEQVLLLAPQEGAATGRSPAMGAVVWSPSERSGMVTLSGMAGQTADMDYQVWLEGPGPGYPSPCGVFHAGPGERDAQSRITLRVPVLPRCRFIVVECSRGGAGDLAQALSTGSIVLATLPYTGRMPNP